MSEWTDRPGPPPEEAAVPERVLAVFGPTNTGKIERHIYPLSTVAETTLVCTEADREVDLRQLEAPTVGIRPLDLLSMFALALIEATREDYDAVVSFSLLPHGCFALAIGRLLGVPVHLGIMGIDIDHHARARYAPAIRWLLRRFDAVTVPGPTHRRRLHDEVGLDPSRTAVLVNPIDADVYRPDPETDPEFDLLWIGRFSEEKDPLRFVDALADLREDDAVDAVMVGDGALAPAVRERVREHGLEDAVTLPGWVDDPLSYYHRSSAFVLSSRRDALPLTLVEAMATGLPVVVTNVGNVPDMVREGVDGVVVDDPTAEALADGVRRLRSDPAVGDDPEAIARRVRERFSYGAAAEDWRGVLRILARRSVDAPARERDADRVPDRAVSE